MTRARFLQIPRWGSACRCRPWRRRRYQGCSAASAREAFDSSAANQFLVTVRHVDTIDFQRNSFAAGDAARHFADEFREIFLVNGRERRIIHLLHFEAPLVAIRLAGFEEISCASRLDFSASVALKIRLLESGRVSESIAERAWPLEDSASGPGRRDISKFFRMPFCTKVTCCAFTPSSSIS